MHELSLAQSIVEIVQDQAQRDGFARVRSIRLSIGALAHVDPRALAFGFDVVARGTVADGATLTIDRPGGRAFCMVCRANVAIGAHGDPCPACAGHQWVLVDGDEMRVVDLEVD
jgi:hydrogenase nickel incorporation protein HypA/HybF